MSQLPPILGKFTRERVVILVTGRTGLNRIGGIASVARHVATARRLGFDPLVVFPARMRALGAEIEGEVDDQTPCLASDTFADVAGTPDEMVLVIVGDWYVSPQAIVLFNDATKGPAVARFEERGRMVAPVARMRIASVSAILPQLETAPTAELVLGAAEPHAEVVPLLVSERHRLSDNVAVEHGENKLFASLGDGDEPWHVVVMQELLAVRLARRLARTKTTPAEIAVAKIVLGLAAAWALWIGTGYWSGVVGALLALSSRVLDVVSTDLARAAVRDSARNERYDLAGDVTVQIAIVWAVAARIGHGYACVLALLASAGVLISAAVSYTRVFRRVWTAQSRGERHDVPRFNYGSRFAQRNGPVYGLLAAALVGRLDLFLWAAVAVSHLFYLGWLMSRETAGR